MTKVYYNENDLFCAEWLYNLQKENLIAPGDIDTRSITDVRIYPLTASANCGTAF